MCIVVLLVFGFLYYYKCWFGFSVVSGGFVVVVLAVCLYVGFSLGGSCFNGCLRLVWVIDGVG